MLTFSMCCNPIDGQSKKGTSNFKLREYNLVPDQERGGWEEDLNPR